MILCTVWLYLSIKSVNRLQLTCMYRYNAKHFWSFIPILICHNTGKAVGSGKAGKPYLPALPDFPPSEKNYINVLNHVNYINVLN